MPKTEVRFYKDSEGHVPVLEWLNKLRDRNHAAYIKCVARIRRLADAGHELRRPEADLLRDGIYELRIRAGTVQYRILYFFHGKAVCILAHAITKEDKVPVKEIEKAITRKKAHEDNPATHFHKEDLA